MHFSPVLWLCCIVILPTCTYSPRQSCLPIPPVHIPFSTLLVQFFRAHLQKEGMITTPHEIAQSSHTPKLQGRPWCIYIITPKQLPTSGFLIWRHQRDSTFKKPSVKISAGHHHLINLKVPPSGLQAHQLYRMGRSVKRLDGNAQQSIISSGMVTVSPGWVLPQSKAEFDGNGQDCHHAIGTPKFREGQLPSRVHAPLECLTSPMKAVPGASPRYSRLGGVYRKIHCEHLTCYTLSTLTCDLVVYCVISHLYFIGDFY